MDLTRYQKFLLSALAGMLLVSSVLMAVFRTRSGALFEGALLKAAEQDGRRVYSGQVRGEPVTISAAWVTNFKAVVEFTVGDWLHDVCEVEYPLEPVRRDVSDAQSVISMTEVNGIRVTKNGEPFFEGGYARWSGWWFDAEGNYLSGIRFGTEGMPSSSSWKGFAVTEDMAARFAFGPEPAFRGEPNLFFLALVLTALTAVEIYFYEALLCFFQETLFRLRYWYIRDPELSELSLAVRRAGLAILTAITAVCYLLALTGVDG